MRVLKKQNEARAREIGIQRERIRELESAPYDYFEDSAEITTRAITGENDGEESDRETYQTGDWGECRGDILQQHTLSSTHFEGEYTLNPTSLQGGQHTVTNLNDTWQYVHGTLHPDGAT